MTIISILSSESVFVDFGDKEVSKEARMKFQAKDGDHLTLLNIFAGFRQSTKQKVSNFIEGRGVHKVEHCTPLWRVPQLLTVTVSYYLK